MSADRFDVVFGGELQPGADPAQVRANLAQLFRTEPAKVARLFDGRAVTLKKNVDATTGRQYLAALAKAGLVAMLAEVVEVAPPPSAPTAPTESPRPVAAGTPGPRPAPVTVPDAIAARGAPPRAPDYSVAEPGAVLVEAETIAPPRIDTAHLSVAVAGELLVEPATVEAPRYDLSGLSLDPPGTQLSDARPVPPKQFDLSRLALQ
jgi:hypothetical protein